MNQEILMVAESVSNEKDLPKDTIFEAIEDGVSECCKKKISRRCRYKSFNR